MLMYIAKNAIIKPRIMMQCLWQLLKSFDKVEDSLINIMMINVQNANH